MDHIRMLLARLRGLFGTERADRRLDDEIAHHLELQTEQNMQLGMAPGEARRRARLAFGAVEAVKEEHRDGRGVRWLEEFVADARHAFRGFRRRPVLGAAAIVTLAIGIGANTAIYSAVSAVILRPLPFTDPGRLVMLWEENPEKGWHRNVVAAANYLDWKSETTAFKDAAAYFAYPNSQTLTGGGDPRVLTSYSVTGNFFSVLGVRPERGRGFADNETWRTGSPVAVISHRLWQMQFGGSDGIIGKTVQLDARSYQVVGVMPASFKFPASDVDVWTPFAWDPEVRSQVFFRRAHYLRAIARLKPGVALAEANGQFQVVVKRLQRDFPATNRVMGAGMTPLQEFLVGDTRTPLLVLLAGVGLLLLIACANVGNLLLIQSTERGREAALRLALGARRWRLVRQTLTESLVLSACGGISGLALGWWGAGVLGAMQPGILPVDHIGISWGVVGYVVAIATASAMLFGIAPMLWIGQRQPGDVLKDGGRGSGASRRMRAWRRGLVVSEIALALVLTVGAGLLVRSFQRLQAVNPGFEPNGVLAVSMNIPGARYDSAAKVSGFYADLLRQVKALPDVRSAALVSSLPLTGGVGWTSDFTAAGRGPDDYGSEVAHRSVSPDYFRTMRVPVKQGRDFTSADALGGAKVVLINEALARSYFRGQNPVGQRIAFDRVPDSSSTWRTIIGVVGDERQAALSTSTQIEMIQPERQAPSTFMNLVVRTTRDPLSLVPAIRATVKRLDPTIAFNSAQSMNDVRDQSLANARFLMILLFGFGAAGLLLAAVGVYGVMAHMAASRTREMGIRIALGARSSSVQWLVIREGMLLTIAGLAIGLALALAGSRAMTSMLYGVTPTDAATFVVVPAVLVLTALLATWLPALRASRADPMRSLRTE